ncbi:NERD domain-containing protein, partial [Clostridium perfringens]|uniref:NERD domain-containing protein n=3 Tax=Clostridium perfringens TaxID=1502 RepID=UPI0028E0C6F8
RLKRRKEHEELVRDLAYYLENKGYKLYEGQIDCLAIKDDIALIFEVKTLNGEIKDERAQVLKALAQLKYYKKFAMGKFSELEKVYSLALFSSKISDQYIEFLEENSIHTLYKENEKISTSIINKIIKTSMSI